MHTHAFRFLYPLLLLWACAVTLHGQTGVYGVFTYVEHDSFIEIVASDSSASGHVIIPDAIADKPVTEIASRAFQSRHEITAITLPESVTSIGSHAFEFCTKLMRINLPSGIIVLEARLFAGCGNLTDIELPAGLESIGAGVFYRTGLTSLSIPAGVTAIGSGAFSFTRSLNHVTIPDGVSLIEARTFEGASGLITITIGRGVTSIGHHAFLRASQLSRVIFLGDSPVLEGDPFVTNAADFATFHFEESSGFTTPTWADRPSVNMGAYSPLKPWLLKNGLDHETNPESDLSGDGVPVLTAYALNLDPHQNLASKLPRARIEVDRLQLSFSATAPGIAYTPETSPDLNVWLSSGITLSPPDAEGHRIASLPLDLPHRFLRLKMEVDDGMVAIEGGYSPPMSTFGELVVSSFQIGRHEVTWGQWKQVRDWAAANGYDIGAAGEGCEDDHPVARVNWYEVVKWCNARSEKEGLTPAYLVDGSVYRTGEFSENADAVTWAFFANGYRLPTAAEWEFAARGGNKSQGYHHSGSSHLDLVGWNLGNSMGAACQTWPDSVSWSDIGTWPVGQKQANELGLYDMSGNVWEWCWNRARHGSSDRIIRGGSIGTDSHINSTITMWRGRNPGEGNSAFGFRLARTAPN